MPDVDARCLILLLAIVLDGLFGDPSWLWRRLPHPVVVMGRLIAALDAALNHAELRPLTRRLHGIGAALFVPALAACVGYWTSRLLGGFPFGGLIEAGCAAVLLAQRSLYDHVAAVAEGLEKHGIEGGRAAVAHIVGRDPSTLDAHGVGRAAIESLAENASDGVVAPLLWYLVAGLPGLLAFKAINTADSMVGHRTPRHRDYGWASARLDDLVNLIPARLSGLIITVAALFSGNDAGSAFRAMLRDAPRHTSPNAGWPEAAMAGALGLALAGPRVYGGTLIAAAFMNAHGRLAVTTADIRAGLGLFLATCAVQAMLVLAAGIVLYGLAT